MKAVVIREHGDIERVRYEDISEPESIAPHEVRVAVRAAALNHLDIWVRKGRPGTSQPFPHVLGSDAAGVVEAVGSAVTQWKVGDEVILNPGLSCGQCAACRRGEQSECIQFGIVGLTRPGTFAEYVVVPAGNLARKPAHLSWEEAAALPLAYVTAWRMLFTRARLQPGETVLIHGIGGGVALAALQLARLCGARVIVTSSSNAKLERAKTLGAADVINYASTENLAGTILDVTRGEGVDVVVDTTGAATWGVNLEVARKGGRIVHCGVTTGPRADGNVSLIYWKQLSVLGSTMGSDEDFRRLVVATEANRLKPVLDNVYPLSEGKEAQRRMERGEQFGKIVLNVST